MQALKTALLAQKNQSSLAVKRHMAFMAQSSKVHMSTSTDNDEDAMTISESLGKWTESRRYYNAQQQGVVDELMQYELTRETRFESEEQMRQRISQFQDIDFSSEAASAQNSESAESVASHLRSQDSQFSQIQDILKNMNVVGKESTILLEDYGNKNVQKIISKEEDRAQLAFRKLQSYQRDFSSDHTFVQNLTLDDLRKSKSLQILIMDYGYTLFHRDPNPKGSFTRTYASELDKEVAKRQSIVQSSQQNVISEREEIEKHNNQQEAEFQGDNQDLTQDNQPEINFEKLLEEIKEEIGEIRKEDEEKADKIEKFIFSTRDEVTQGLSRTLPKEELKFYPGSNKGPEPEDDPESYGKWYFENQPKSLYPEGNPNADDLGVKFKFLIQKNDDKEERKINNIIPVNPVVDFFNRDYLHYSKEASCFEGRPEWALHHHQNFKLQEDDAKPEVCFSSITGPNELPPFQPDKPMMYQRVHFGLEPWSAFKQLPALLKYERGVYDFLINVKQGLQVCPDFQKERSPPSLWTYYQTLPQWCRDHPLIRQTLFAFEYSKPHLTIRQKELGMNFMASMLTPVEGRLRTVISQVAYSNKLRVNSTNGKELMQEMNMYVIDVADLGSDTEQEDDDNAEKEFNKKLLSGGLDKKDDEEDDKTMLQRVMDELNVETDEAREKERRKIYDEEMQIHDFELDPETQKCAVDFAVKEYATIDEIQAADDIANSNQVPINYYDNDDGFWDEWIALKQQSQVEAGFITSRTWFKH